MDRTTVLNEESIAEQFFRSDGKKFVEGIDYQNQESKTVFLTAEATQAFMDFILTDYIKGRLKNGNY